jgi:hypothetical protein
VTEYQETVAAVALPDFKGRTGQTTEAQLVCSREDRTVKRTGRRGSRSPGHRGCDFSDARVASRLCIRG